MNAVIIKTAKSRYPVEGLGADGIVVRQPSGKRRVITRREVGSARYYNVVSQVLARARRDPA